MAKSNVKKVVVFCELQTTFCSYGNAKYNNHVRKSIKEAIQNVLIDHASFIGFEDPISGESCATNECKIWVHLDKDC